MEVKLTSEMSRDEFIRLMTMTMITLMSRSTYAFRKTVSNPTLDQQMRDAVGKARALSFQPAGKNDIKDYDFIIARSSYIAKLSRMHMDGGYKPGSMPPSVGQEIVSGFNEIGKENTNRLGAGITLAAGTLALIPPLAFTMAIVSLTGSGISFYSSFMKDDISRSMLNLYSIDQAKMLWHDPEAKKIMTEGVKETLKKSYGIDFGATLDEHKQYLSPEQQKYIDFYLQNKGLSPEQRSTKEEENMKKLVSQVNSSLEEGLKEIKSEISKKEKKKADSEFVQGEIQGGVYLATFLANKILGDDAGRIVGAIASSAAQTYALVATLSAAGPIGMAAGAVAIVMNLGSLLGKKESTDQIILNSIKKVHESIIEMHKEMRESFATVINNQQEMMKRIDAQFDLLGKKQKEALLEIKAARDAIGVGINNASDRGREQYTNTILLTLKSFETELRMKQQGKQSDEKFIFRGMDIIDQYAMELSKKGDFTRSSNTTSGWDAKNIHTLLSTVDWIDYFIGLLPLIVERFAPSSKISIPHNPRALGQGGYALASAYMMFPEQAKTFEKGRSEPLVEKMQVAIRETRNTMKISTSKKTLDQFKKEYMEIVAKALDEALAAIEKKHSTDNRKNITASVAGPITPLVMTDNPGNNYIPVEAQYGVTLRYLPSRDNRIMDLSNERNFINPLWTVTTHDIRWKGHDISDPEKVGSTSEMLDMLSKYEIIKLETGPSQQREIKYGEYTKWIPIGDDIFKGDQQVKPYFYNSLDVYFAKKITILKTGDKKPIVIGDGIDSGWIEGTITNIKAGYGVRQQPYPDIPKLSYISIDLLDKPFVGNTSITFLDNLKEVANFVYNVRQDIIVSVPLFIEDSNNGTSMELEAAAICLKYLAGISSYLHTGDIGYSTKVFFDKVEGVNTFKEEDKDGNIDTKNAPPPLIATRQQLANVIRDVTSPTYIHDPKYLDKRANSHRALSEFIRTETLSKVSQAFDRYRYSYFSEKSTIVNLPELTIPEMMLHSVQLVVSPKKRTRATSLWPRL